MNDDELSVRQAFADQAQWCRALGSPFMERLMSGIGTKLDKKTATGTRILEWQGGKPDASEDAVPLRLAGALHYLVRNGDLPKLQPFYVPNAKFNDSALIDIVFDALHDYDADIDAFLDFAPQTNEVRRASIVYAGLQSVLKRFDMPVSLFELGCSAGLNLQLDKFAYKLRDKFYGQQTSKVSLSPEWDGNLFDERTPDIVLRYGCDLNPLPVSDQENCDRLIAYIWPDQLERIARTKAAIEIARADPPILAKADAAEWVEDMLKSHPCSGSCRVFYHTIAWQYFPDAVKYSIRDTFSRYGEMATSDNPLVWLSFEMNAQNTPELVIQAWPGGKRKLLAQANPHVQWIKWFEN